MKRLLPLALLSVLCYSCGDEKEDPSTNPPTEEPKILEGVLVDAAVQGVTYISGDTTGITDAAGTFRYEEGNQVTFKVGDVLLGEVAGEGQITPLELSGVANATVNTQEVRNIAAFLQSLDQDKDPSNGITIAAATAEALQGESMNFTTDNFLNELTSLIAELNAAGADLAVVTSNQAAEHLASSLGATTQFEFLPRVIEGREWEEGTYYAYNTAGRDDPAKQYLFRIFQNGDSVWYNFGNDNGFIMNMEYKNDSLFGFGNSYADMKDLTTENPNWEYRNRVTSPGVVFDYNDSTFLGYYNYMKTAGELGKLEGTYTSFFFYDQKRTGEEPFKQQVLYDEFVLEKADTGYSITVADYDVNGVRTVDTTYVLPDALIDTEKIMLVRLHEKDYLFAQFGYTFFPGLYAVKHNK